MANNKVNFKKIATEELTLSELMVGREQVKTEELTGYDQLTIVAFDFATITDKGEEKVFPVILFKELPENYYNGGTLLNKLCIAWAAAFDGDCEEASKELMLSGGVPVHFKETKTKSGNNLTSIEIL